MKQKFRIAIIFVLIVCAGLVLQACGGAKVETAPPANTAGEVMIMSVEAITDSSVIVTFSGPVSQSVANTDIYDIQTTTGTKLEVSAVYLSEDKLSVTLATAKQVPTATYELSVQGYVLINRPNEENSEFDGSGNKAPIIERALSLNSQEVIVRFSHNMEGGEGVLDAQNYKILDPDLNVESVRFAKDKNGTILDGNTVILSTAVQLENPYTLKVTNVFTKEDNSNPKSGYLIDYFGNTAPFDGISANDNKEPELKSAVSTNNTTVLLSFSEPVTDTASNISNYSIADANSNPLVITAAELNHFKTQVTLTTLAQAKEDYTLTAKNTIKDRVGNALVAVTLNFTGIPVGGLLNADTEAPKLTTAGATSNTSVVLSFSEALEKIGAETASNYRIFSEAKDSAGLATQAIVSVTAASLNDSGTTVTLTTLQQTEILYTVQVTGITDLAGNSISAQDALTEPFNLTTFFGVGANGFVDSDGDGLTDAEEQLGWNVTIEFLERSDIQAGRANREVTSDPGDPSKDKDDPVNVAARDTDNDGVNDFDEKNYSTDPRDPDTDNDGLTDNQELNEFYSNPFDQDTDDDGLADGLEVNSFSTSPLFADTDGDQFTDDYEVFTDNRNARIADLPRVLIDVGNVDLRLDVRFEEQTSNGTTTLDSKTVEATLAESEESSRAKETSTTKEWFAKGGGGFCFGGSCNTGEGNVGFDDGFEGNFEAGGGGANTSTWNTASSRETQREYATTLATDKEISVESSVTRVLEGASMAVEVNLQNASNIAFTISNIEITALIQDPRNPREFVPVATLFSASSNPISIGPLSPNRGPFRFVASEAFPEFIESLMQYPRGLLFKVANYEITDEFGRDFSFVEQDINDRTAFLEIDYAGEEDMEKYRVSTNSSFNSDGAPVGLSMKQVMEDVLGLEYISATEDAVLTDKQRLETSYSTRTVEGVEALYRVKSVSMKDIPDRIWWVLGPNGLVTPSKNTLNPGLSWPGSDFNTTTVFSGQDFAFKFVKDSDGDLLESDEEAFYHSVDSATDTVEDPDNPDSIDTDNDGILDVDEVFGLNRRDGTPREEGWKIRFDDGQDTVRTYSSPSTIDTDNDGLTDCQELRGNIDIANSRPNECQNIIVYLDSSGLPTLQAKDKFGDDNTFFDEYHGLGKATNPQNPDTDGDGISDADEVVGFAYHSLLKPNELSIIKRDQSTTNFYATNPVNVDTDGDGFDDFKEIKLGTDPTVPDGDDVRDDDGDGLVNIQEITGWLVEISPPKQQTYSYVVKSDPNDPDSDDDGLTDWEEFMGCRDRNGDLQCDSDNRFDRTLPVDVFQTTDPFLRPQKGKDSDGDGLSDVEEVEGIAFPSDVDTPIRFTNPADGDTDHDLTDDYEELKKPWTVNVVGFAGALVYSDPLKADSDLDGLFDFRERELRSNPNVQDTDNDGRFDRLENDSRTNILVPDHYVTVKYTGIQLGKGSASAEGDCDKYATQGAADLVFQLGVIKPGESKMTDPITNNNSTSNPDLPKCDDNEHSVCKATNKYEGFPYLQIVSPDKFYMTNEIKFILPFTQSFALEGDIWEIDVANGDKVKGHNFEFGGLADTALGIFNGSSDKGTTYRAFEYDKPGCEMEVTASVTLE